MKGEIMDLLTSISVMVGTITDSIGNNKGRGLSNIFPVLPVDAACRLDEAVQGGEFPESEIKVQINSGLDHLSGNKNRFFHVGQSFPDCFNDRFSVLWSEQGA